MRTGGDVGGRVAEENDSGRVVNERGSSDEVEEALGVGAVRRWTRV